MFKQIQRILFILILCTFLVMPTAAFAQTETPTLEQAPAMAPLAYNASLTLQSANPEGNAGTTATFQVELQNLDVAETYTIICSGPWAACTPQSYNLALNEKVTYTGTVNIPAGASNGQTSVITVSASTANNAYSKTLDVTAKANVPTPTPSYGVSLTAAGNSQSGQEGTDVFYNLTVTNTGNVNDIYRVNCTGVWNTTCTFPQVPLKPGESSSLVVQVHVPDKPVVPASDISKVSVISTNDSNVFASTTLTTTLEAAAATPTPAGTPTPENPGLPPTNRPLMVIEGYSISGGAITPGKDFDLNLNFENKGRSAALNIILSLQSTEFIPRDTGGITAVDKVESLNHVTISQAMATSPDLAGKTLGSLTGTINYQDAEGKAYTESFTFAIDIKDPVKAGSGSYASPTPTLSSRSQLVVSEYTTDIKPLEPGTIFNLGLTVQNLGTSPAKAVTMVIGGSAAAVDNASGTPSPSGVSGGGSELSNFAPLGSSNLLYIGDMPAGVVQKFSANLIVNVNTAPGAYPLKLSFVYTDAKNNRVVDDQLITLLIHQVPRVQAGYYRDPGPGTVGMPIMLPVQISNVGKKSIILSQVKFSSDKGEFKPDSAPIGTIDIGGYFSFDAQFTPKESGPINLDLEISYTDDFNQPQIIKKNLNLVVDAMPTPDPSMSDGGMDGMPAVEEKPETFLDKIVRFFKGLLGLGSGTPPANSINEGGMEPNKETEPMPAQPKG